MSMTILDGAQRTLRRATRWPSTGEEGALRSLCTLSAFGYCILCLQCQSNVVYAHICTYIHYVYMSLHMERFTYHCKFLLPLFRTAGLQGVG